MRLQKFNRLITRFNHRSGIAHRGNGAMVILSAFCSAYKMTFNSKVSFDRNKVIYYTNRTTRFSSLLHGTTRISSLLDKIRDVSVCMEPHVFVKYWRKSCGSMQQWRKSCGSMQKWRNSCGSNNTNSRLGVVLPSMLGY